MTSSASTHAQRHVYRGVGSDDPEAGPERNFEIEAVVDDEHRRRLAQDRKPPQPHQGVQADMAQRLRRLLVEDFGHI
jgi:hypothetical protein